MGFWRKNRQWICGVVIGMILFAIGAAQGQFAVIYKKTVMICMECIGIG